MQRGWLVGVGNVHGAGIYFSRDVSVAKAYASGGVYLKCLIKLGRVAHWDAKQTAQFSAWRRTLNVLADMPARSGFLLQNGYSTLMDGKLIVVLRPQYANPAAHMKHDSRVRVLGVYNAGNDRRVWV